MVNLAAQTRLNTVAASGTATSKITAEARIEYHCGFSDAQVTGSGNNGLTDTGLPKHSRRLPATDVTGFQLAIIRKGPGSVVDGMNADEMNVSGNRMVSSRLCAASADPATKPPTAPIQDMANPNSSAIA